MPSVTTAEQMTSESGLLACRRGGGAGPPSCSYQLVIRLRRQARIQVGRLGCFEFPAGQYVYTGSARHGREARLRRHRSRTKALHWHIDYLLANPDARIIQVRRSRADECVWNQRTSGRLLVKGFGASDCRHGCRSHLKYQP